MPSASQKFNSSSAEASQALSLHISQAICEKGYIVLDDYIAKDLAENLLQAFQSIAPDDFKKAGIGKQQDFQINEELRGDKIHWLENNNPALLPYAAQLEEVRLAINQQSFLGLFDLEVHFAYYPMGACYKKHLDAFKGSSTRVVSSILYLNPQWEIEDGGALILYAPDGVTVLETIYPTFGRQVFFLSQMFPHEVLPAKRPRRSLTGWFRRNVN